MWKDTCARFLEEECRAVVATLTGVPELSNILHEALERGHGGEPVGERYRSSLLPLGVYDAIRGEYEPALPAAAAYHFLLAAAEVFDDAEDADSSQSLPARYGAAIATNAAATLLILAERAVTRLEKRGIPDRLIVRAMDALNSYYTVACAGQHLDLSLPPGQLCSEDEYLRIAGMKSASQSECACHIGALLATEDLWIIDRFSVFGNKLGIISQIANDIQGVNCGGDLLHSRISLPVIYALHYAEADTVRLLESAFIRKDSSACCPSDIKEALFRCGAVHYAMIQMESYRQQASDILSELEERGINSRRLKPFLG